MGISWTSGLPLETHGVVVLAYRTEALQPGRDHCNAGHGHLGQVGGGEFPAFFSCTSGHEAPLRVNSADEIAAVMAAKGNLGIVGGIAVVNPIPAEDEIPRTRSTASSIRRSPTWRPAGPGVHAVHFLGRIVETPGGAA